MPKRGRYGGTRNPQLDNARVCGILTQRNSARRLRTRCQTMTTQNLPSLFTVPAVIGEFERGIRGGPFNVYAL